MPLTVWGPMLHNSTKKKPFHLTDEKIDMVSMLHVNGKINNQKDEAPGIWSNLSGSLVLWLPDGEESGPWKYESVWGSLKKLYKQGTCIITLLRSTISS